MGKSERNVEIVDENLKTGKISIQEVEKNDEITFIAGEHKITVKNYES